MDRRIVMELKMLVGAKCTLLREKVSGNNQMGKSRESWQERL